MKGASSCSWTTLSQTWTRQTGTSWTPRYPDFTDTCSKALSGGSRAIVTTRYPPSDVPVLPSKVHREDLGDFPESSFLKIMQRDPEVERRSRSGELPMALLRELYQEVRRDASLSPPDP